jgi:hypothetical protein
MMIHIVAYMLDFEPGVDIDCVFRNIDDAVNYAKNVPLDGARSVILTTFIDGVTDEVWVNTRSTKFDFNEHIIGIYQSEDEAIAAWSEMEENDPMGDNDVGGYECFKIKNHLENNK